MKIPGEFRILDLLWHPVLWGIFPVLALYAYNITEIKLTEAERSFIIAFCMALILLLVLRLIIREWHRAAAISLLVLLAFFSYGHVYQFLEGISPAGLRRL